MRCKKTLHFCKFTLHRRCARFALPGHLAYARAGRRIAPVLPTSASPLPFREPMPAPPSVPVRAYIIHGKNVAWKRRLFLPRFHARFYNSLIINTPGNEAWPHPDSHYIRADFKTSYDVLGDTSFVLSVKYSPAKAVPYLKGLSICFFIISIYISNTYLYTKFFVKFLLRFS